VLVAVAYDFQLVEKVPTNRRDKKMDYIILPTKGVIQIKRD
jgi:5-formyltetrahydrofolate cyclo-ligase